MPLILAAPSNGAKLRRLSARAGWRRPGVVQRGLLASGLDAVEPLGLSGGRVEPDDRDGYLPGRRAGAPLKADGAHSDPLDDRVRAATRAVGIHVDVVADTQVCGH